MNNAVTTVTLLYLIEFSSFLQKTRFTIKSWMDSKFSQIRRRSAVRQWKENLPCQKYAFLEGIVFQLNNFTMDGFSFQLVFSLKIGRFYHPS